jgi:DNA-binding beta-propeller fold protein YncE
VDPRAVAADDKGNVYVLERSGHALRVIDKGGKIRTVAGDGKKGNAGNGGPALKAELNGPKYVSIDRDGSVLIADTENHQIRRYVPGKETVELVMGTGKAGKGLDADPLKCELARPHGVSVHPKTGDLYVADSDNGRILKVERK